jgi:hypothetical protein
LKIYSIAALAVAWSLAAGPVLADTKVLEGTEFPMRLEDALSSKTAAEGDRFTVSLTEDVTLSDGTVLKAGYRGVGEVIEARSNGMMGKSGKLNVRLEYLKVGDQKVRLRAQKSVKGENRTTTQVVTFVFVGVFAGFVKGKNVSIPKGASINGFADQDVVLTAPIAPPPADV